jgi:hypothetical protein
MNKPSRNLVLLFSAFFLLTGCHAQSTGSVGTNVSSIQTISVGKVTEIRYDVAGKKITWKAVSNADSYEVTINQDAAKTASTNSFAYEAGTADFSVSIVAVSSIGNSKGAKVTTNIHYLKPPSKNQLTYSYGVISWPAVTGASQYQVSVNGEESDVNGTSYTIPDSISELTFAVTPKAVDTETDAYYTSTSETTSYHLVGRPTLAFAKNALTISWNAVSGVVGYHLLITLEGKTVHEETFGSSASSSVNFAFSEAGSYQVNLASIGDKTAGTYDSGYAHITIRRLGVPTQISALEGTSSVDIGFTGVTYASSYIVSVDGVATGSTSTNTYSYPLADQTGEEESHTFKVVSHSDDNYVLDSLEGATITLIKLAKPKNIRLENGRVIWDAVNKAVAYDVIFDGVVSTVDTNQYVLSQLGEGSHQISIRAVGNKSTILRSGYTNQTTITKLKAPTSLTVSDGHVLNWDTVTGANGYEVRLDNGATKYDAVGTSFSIPAIAASTTISVVAKGDGGFIMDSNPSTPMSLYALSAPINLSVKDGALIWNAVDQASSYELTIGDKVEKLTGSSFSMESYAAGDYIVKVKAIGKGQYFTSVDSQPISITKLPAVTNISFDATNGISWDKVAEATGYSIFIDGAAPITVAKDKLNYNAKPNFITSGVHTVNVRALGNDSANLLPSVWKQAQTTAGALAVPSDVVVARTTTGFKVTATVDANAQGLAVSFSGKVYTSTTGEVDITTSTAGAYDIYCYAIGDGTLYVNSERTTSTTVTILSAVGNLRLAYADTDYYLATWDPVTNADKYKVHLKKYTSDTAFTESDVVVTAAKLGIDTTGLTKLDVTVVAASDNAMTLDSEGQLVSKSFN